MSCQEELQDVQWSLHFGSFICIVLLREIAAFYVDSRTLISLVETRRTIDHREDHSVPRRPPPFDCSAPERFDIVLRDAADD